MLLWCIAAAAAAAAAKDCCSCANVKLLMSLPFESWPNRCWVFSPFHFLLFVSVHWFHAHTVVVTPFPTSRLVANFICQLSLSLFYCFFCCSFASLEEIFTALVMEVVVVMVVNLFKGSSVSHSFTSHQVKTVTRSVCYRAQSLPPLVFCYCSQIGETWFDLLAVFRKEEIEIAK